MESPTTWLGIFGVILITILLCKKQTASFAVISGVLFVSVLSWFKGTEVSYFESDVLTVHGGMNAKERWDYFTKVGPRTPQPVLVLAMHPPMPYPHAQLGNPEHGLYSGIPSAALRQLHSPIHTGGQG